MLGELESFCRERRSLFYPKADLPVADGVLRTLGSAGNPAGLVPVAARLCRAVFGDEPSSVAPLGEAGTFHLLYRAEGPDGRSAVVRLSALSHLRHDFLLHLDSWAGERLRAVGLPGLRVHAVDLSRAHCPYDFEILEEARGTALKAYDDDDDRLRPLLAALGRFAAQVHGVKSSGFGFFDVRPLLLGELPEQLCGLSPTWRVYVLRRLDAHVATCEAIGAVSHDERRRIYDAFLAADDLLDGVEPALLHGDLGSHNVFTDGRDITAVIDWEDALSGDPVFDVAFWATFHPDRRHAAFLDGYRSVRALPADFERRFWLYYLRVALSKTVLRHRLGVTDRPGRPPASLRIQKALERLEALQGSPSRAA
jgi:Ser/Thr protein kinase RdoA (MazF antagonist)